MRKVKLQIPPLRFASVGMTKFRLVQHFIVGDQDREPQVPLLRYPAFSVRVDGVGEPHAAFLKESRTRCHG